MPKHSIKPPSSLYDAKTGDWLIRISTIRAVNEDWACVQHSRRWRGLLNRTVIGRQSSILIIYLDLHSVHACQTPLEE
jgi:hypothetical protein